MWLVILFVFIWFFLCVRRGGKDWGLFLKLIEARADVGYITEKYGVEIKGYREGGFVVGGLFPLGMREALEREGYEVMLGDGVYFFFKSL